jgi:F-type H+-transporting ATPase subunit a
VSVENLPVQAAESAHKAQPEFPNIVGSLAEHFSGTPFGHFLHFWESIIYSLLVITILGTIFYFATRKRAAKPGRLQNFAEFYVTFVDDFVCGVLGKRGSKYTPFIGTLFIYILAMNYIGLIPFLKSPTSDWSATLGLALIVFFYVQYTAFKELGFLGYFDHMMGNPRGPMAWTLIMPLFLFSIHFVSELVRPLSLSLRLRSNIYGDDMILALFASWGIKDGFVWLLPNFFLVILASTIQAAVFSILTLVYFSLIMKHDESHH